MKCDIRKLLPGDEKRVRIDPHRTSQVAQNANVHYISLGPYVVF